MISTGIKYLDKLTSGLRLGDNVVWQISNGVPIEYFTRDVLNTENSYTSNIVYINFNYSPHTVCKRFDEIFKRETITMIDAFTHGKGNSDQVFLDFYDKQNEYDTSRIVCVENPKDMSSFIKVMNRIEQQNTSGSFYIFDSLTGMNELWKDERLVVDFFSFTCPKLYDLNTIAYWILEKGAHSRKFTAELSHITQIVVNVDNTDSGYYDLRINKLEGRPVHHVGISHHFKIIDKGIQFVEPRGELIRIGNRVKELRKAQNITQAELASQMGMTPGAISQIENDLITPSLSTLVQLASILKKPVEYFIQSGIPESGRGFSIIRGSGIAPAESETFTLTSLYDDRRLDIKVFHVMMNSLGIIEGPLMLHKGKEFITILNGSLQIRIDGEDVQLQKNDSLLVERSFIERWQNIKKNSCEFIYMLL